MQKSPRSNRHNAAALRLLASAATTLLIATQPAFAQPGAPLQEPSPQANVGLKPATRDQVRAIGQALLATKRLQNPDQDATAMRQQLQAVRARLQVLTMAVPTRVSVLKDGQAATPQKDAWLQVRASDIAEARKAAAALAQNGRTLKKKYRSENADGEPGFIEKHFPDAANRYRELAARVSGTTPPQPAAPQSRFASMTPVNETTLSRFDSLESDIAAAVALPADKRQARLHALIDELTPNETALVARTHEHGINPTISAEAPRIQ